MKKHSKLFVTACALMTALTVGSAAASFEKVATYTEGTFKDVGTQWYAKEVASAYELGFVNGKTATTYDPDGTMTVAEGITLASRIHASYNQNTIASVSGKWYQMYVDYAKQFGIMKDGDFNSYDRTIRRYEMASLFANALPEEYYTAKNNVSSIPDVDENEEYADTLIMLYKAGVVMGSDEYGTFHPTDPIKRSEVAAIVNRAAIVDNRLSKTLTPAPTYDNEALYLIDNYQMVHTSLRYTRLASSWNYDNRFDESVVSDGVATNALVDTTTEGYVAINRAFTEQTNGKLTFRTSYTFADGSDGFRVYFTDSDGNNVLEFFTDNGVYYARGLAETKSSLKASVGTHTLKAYIDLDAKKGYFTVDGQKGPEFELGEFKNFGRIYISTSVEDTLSVTVNTCHLYKNYFVNEDFYSESYPEDWEKASNTEIIKGNYDAYGTGTLKLNGSTTVTKKFDELSGKFVFESYVLVPESADVATIKVGDVAVKINNSLITSGSISKSQKGHIWQCIHIEGDTEKDKATIYINGKKQGNVAMTSDKISSVSFTYEKKSSGGYMLVDDVEVYNTYDYLDYVTKPTPTKDDGYTTIMSVCSLWREGTHLGWDYVAPYDEASPLLGYYDEGVPEVADWETKYMVEHGIDAFQYCWFSPVTNNFTDPIKTPQLAWSQHDGYFYSKYSDMVDFCFMWENSGWSWVSKPMTEEQFKTYLWDYWVEWYFTDSRYLCIDNKPVLHIYKPDNFISTFGSEAEAKKIIEFMRKDIKNYGFDGIIILFQDGNYKLTDITKYDNIGADGIMTYAWGSNSYDPSFYTDLYSKALSSLSTSKTDMYIVPTVGTGRNILGWNNTRTPLSTTDEHKEVMEYLKSVVANQTIPGNMIYFGTWNEFGEGHWLAPSGLNGFGYADVWRETLTGSLGTHDDVTPTINQKARICNLYDDTRAPIRSQLNEKNEIPAVAIQSFDFLGGYVPEFGPYGTSGVWSLDRLVKCEVEDTGLVLISESNDPIIRSPLNLNISTEEMIGIKFSIKSEVVSNAQIFFITDLDDRWEASKRFDITIGKSDDYVDYYIDCTSNPLWTGNVQCIRFDLLDGFGRMDIAKIEYVAKSDATGSVIVDGLDLEIPGYYVNHTSDEFYVVGDPDYGIFSANNFYYEWNKNTKVLFVKTGTDTEFVFTVGSDKAKVNGKEVSLKKAFYTYDGMPVLPMKFILDNASIKYTLDKDLVIKMREIDMAEILQWRKENPWNFEFDIAGDAENFLANNGTISVANGKLVLTAGESSSAATGHDSGIYMQDITLPATKYDKLEIRYRYELLTDKIDVGDKYDSNSSLQVFFDPSTNPGLSEGKSFKVKIDETPVDSEGWHVATFDLTSNADWGGVVNRIRIDPTNHNIVFTVDHIKFILKEGAAAEVEGSLDSLVGDGELVYDMDFKADGDENHPMQVVRASYSYEGDDIVLVTGAENDVILNLNLPEALMSAANFDTAIVRMKVETDVAGKAQFFYQNGVMSSFEGEASTTCAFEPGKNVDDEGYFLLKFDFTTKKSKFTGDIKAIRFDPADMANTTFRIDYIKFYKCGEGGGSEEATIPQLTAADVTTPGVIYNGDAEGDDISMWWAGGANLEVVTEENGNRAFMLKSNTGAKTWVYLMTEYNFIPGKTYKIEADIKVVSDENGNKGESKVTCNFRYQDSINGQNGYDHNTVFAVSSGEWAHIEGEYKVETMDKPQNKQNQVSFYCNPIGDLGCNYMVDNVKITLVD